MTTILRGWQNVAMLHASSLIWFRRDLRSFDNAALHAALTQSARVHCVFVFDREILDALADKADRRVEFIWESVVELRAALHALGGSLHVLYDVARAAIPNLAQALDVDAVFTNHDYEPAALARDAAVATQLKARSEERRVGKECDIPCRSRWSPYH